MSNRRLNAVITIGGAVTAGLRSAIGSTVDGLRRIGSTVQQVSRQQRDVGAQIEANRRAGRSVRELEEQYNRLGRTLERLRAAQNRLARNHQATEANNAARAGYRSKIGETVAMAAIAGGPIVAAAQFEKAMLGVAKQVQGARDDAGNLTKVYFDMAKQVQILGRETPIATNEIAEMVAAGARMGVAKDELIGFTKTAAMMASAFELPAGELADQMGKIAGLYKIPIPAIGQLADTINYLDDNAISKGADIIDFLTRTGGVAGAVKVTGQEMAALGSTLLTLGERTETAGTATNALFTKLAAADKGTKKFKSAMKEIGLSTNAIQKGMQIDAQGTLLKVLDAVAKLPKDKQIGVLSELVGLEHSDTLAKLSTNMAEYRKQIQMAGSAEAKGSMSREYQAQRATTLAQWQMMKNRTVELAVSLGSVLLPAVNQVMGKIGDIAQKVSEWSQAHPKLTKAIVGTVVVLASVRVAALAAGYAFTVMRGSVLAVTGAYARVSATMATMAAGSGRMAGMVTWLGGLFAPLRAAIVSLIPGILSVGAAIMATPVGWVIAGIAAIVAGGVLIYKYWEPLKAFFVGFGEGFMEAFGPIGKAISDAFAPIWEVIGPVVMPMLETLGGWVKSAITWFTDLFTPIDKASQTTKDFASAGKLCGYVVAESFNIMLKPILLVHESIMWIANNIGEVIKKASQLGSSLSGGWDAAKNFVTGGPGPAPALPAMRGAGGEGSNNTTTNDIKIYQQPGQDSRALAAEVQREIERKNAVKRRSNMTDGALAN